MSATVLHDANLTKHTDLTTRDVNIQTVEHVSVRRTGHSRAPVHTHMQVRKYISRRTNTPIQPQTYMEAHAAPQAQHLILHALLP